MSVSYQYGLIANLFKARQNLLKQLSSQGYDISEYNNFTFSEINVLHQKNQQDMILSHSVDGTKLYVNYYVEKALRANNIQDMVEDLFHIEQVLTPNDTLLIVSKDQPNDTLINSLIQLYADQNILVCVIPMPNLQFVLLDHTLVPKHKKLSLEEKEELTKRYAQDSLPKISRFDPVAVMIGLRPGEVCEITRASPTAMEGKYYRSCINK
jgi:DNA-directed RNA polymerase subunit H (RpoH/RPB5)